MKLLELADRAVSIEKEKKRIQRSLDQSKRASNPGKYNTNGTIIRSRTPWIFSNRYLKNRYKLNDIQRKQAEVRRMQHNILANQIIEQADARFVEKMNFKGLQVRSKKAEISKKTGRFKRKKRFGKSLAKKPLRCS